MLGKYMSQRKETKKTPLELLSAVFCLFTISFYYRLVSLEHCLYISCK